jgi:amidase
VQLWDCFGNAITSSQQRFAGLAELLSLVGGLNPLSGPIYVEGALPGDVLAVHIDRIHLGTVQPYAVTVVVPGVGGVCSSSGAPRSLEPDTRLCPLDGEHVVLPTSRGPIRLPLKPMLGTIGTAPADGRLSSLEFSPQSCGNIDCPEATIGSTLLVPVNVPGALLSVGDLHAAMGDAEITGTALETSGDVVLRCEVLSARTAGYLACPQIANDTWLGSLGCHFGRSLDFNVRSAFADLADRLTRFHGLAPHEAYELLGAAGRVRVHQSVDGGWTAASAHILRTALPELLDPLPHNL